MRCIPLLVAAAQTLFPLRVADPAPPAGAIAPAVRDTTFAVPDSVQGLLTYILSLRAGPERSFYLADSQLPFVLQLDRRGRLVRTIGRQGSGPGEFSRPTFLGWRGDTLWVDDQGLLRLTLFGPAGSGVSTISQYRALQLPGSRPSRTVNMVATLALLPDGDLLVYRPPAGADTMPALILRVSRAYEIRDTVARLSAAHGRFSLTFSEGGLVRAQPFGDDPLADVSPDGRWLLRVDRPAAARGGEARFSVALTELGHGARYGRDFTYRPAPVPDDTVASFVRWLTDRPPGAASPYRIPADSVYRKLFRPRNFPPVADARVATDGTVWLRLTDAETQPLFRQGRSVWVALSPRGIEVARVAVPAAFQAKDVERGALFGAEYDKDGVPHLVRYLVPGGGSGVNEQPG
jgi:hypothetical protein